MRIRMTVFILMLAITFLGVSLYPASARALDPKDAACQGVTLTGGSCTTDPNATENKINSTIATVINIFSWIVGITAVIMIIIGGFKYITSQGDSGNVSGAKNTILYAVIGLVIVAMAQVIVKFVLNKL